MATAELGRHAIPRHTTPTRHNLYNNVAVPNPLCPVVDIKYYIELICGSQKEDLNLGLALKSFTFIKL